MGRLPKAVSDMLNKADDGMKKKRLERQESDYGTFKGFRDLLAKKQASKSGSGQDAK